ncbi:MAG: folylpolyglutamate synthase/dihydrofolate synthase family protein [Sporomusaceae bacterium]|nr:folylpolyglutamate synthase/dihydrofolate synthase family protein [Sporomusaceae bacterium]
MDYAAALAYLESLGKFGSQLGLERIQKLTELMGNPQQKYRTIHVTGTNGKGSTSTLIAASLQASGIRTGLYTSPHLHSYCERMKLGGKNVSEDDFAAAIFHTAKFVQQMVDLGLEHPTEFEVLTAAAFYLFAEKGVEYAVIEVGLGGLLDSTNVIIPEVSVITNVSLEHMDRCGDTVEAIAAHKAGIIKAGRPVVTAAVSPALEVIAAKAEKLGSALYSLDRDFSVKILDRSQERQKLAVNCWGKKFCLELSLLGHHQAQNGAVAAAALLLLAKQEQRISLESLQAGFAMAKWPGRFEIIPGEPVMIFDGAHNPAGIQVLKNTLAEYFPGRRFVFVLGILRDKNIAEMVADLIEPDDRVVVTEPISERACDAEAVADFITKFTKLHSEQIQVAATIPKALELARNWAEKDRVVCIAGSLYLIGEARQYCQ